MRKNITFFWIKQKSKKKEKNTTENTGKNYLNNLTSNHKSRNDIKSNFIKCLYSKIKESLNKNSSKKIIQSTSFRCNYNNNDKINKTENNINLHIQIFNANSNKNDININNVNSTNRINTYSRTKENIELSKLKKGKLKYKRLFLLDNISPTRIIKMNLRTNYISFIRNISNKNINNKSLNNPIKLTNYSFMQNKNIIFYRKKDNKNSHFSKRNPYTTKINFQA